MPLAFALVLTAASVAEESRFSDSIFSNPLSDSNERAPTTRAVSTPFSLSQTFGQLPLSFEALPGENADFLGRGAGYAIHLSREAATILLPRASGISPSHRGRGSGMPIEASIFDTLRITIEGASLGGPALPERPLPSRHNYLNGQDSRQWRIGVPTFARLRYSELYPGVDLVYYGNQRQLEFDFEVAPGADPSQIRLGIKGASAVEIDENGDLLLRTPGGVIRQRKPVAFQEMEGVRKPVMAEYRLVGEMATEARFELGPYDSTHRLIIDPVVVYSTYLGGRSNDKIWDMAVDASGNAYLTGETFSFDFPITNAVFPVYRAFGDCFVTKIGPEGTNLIYSTFIGGSAEEIAYGLDLDSQGQVYVTGFTASSNFPVTLNAYSRHINSIDFFGVFLYDPFIVKLDAAGTNLLYGTYIGGSGWDNGIDITTDGTGIIYLAGFTGSSDFPTAGVPSHFTPSGQPVQLGDVFVLALDSANTNLIFSRYLGAQGEDRAQGIALDAQGNVLFTGFTSSPDFPVTNAWQPTYGGGASDAFLAKVNGSNGALLYSTLLGGKDLDEGIRMTIDSTGAAYLTGRTLSTNFPVINALYSINQGGSDAFVSKFSSDGSQLQFSTYLGGSRTDEGWSIALDSQSNVYLAGLTSSTNFPITDLPSGGIPAGQNGFVTILSPDASTVDYSTILGGSLSDAAYAVAADTPGFIYVAGITSSANFQPTPGNDVVQPNFGGGVNDGFVVKLVPANEGLEIGQTSDGHIVISWPATLGSLTLQYATSIGPSSSWTDYPEPPVSSGNLLSVTITNLALETYFRLE